MNDIHISVKGGATIPIESINHWTVLSSSSDLPHWGWLAFWAVVFFPIAVILLVVGICRKKYEVEIEFPYTMSQVVHLPEKEIYKLDEFCWYKYKGNPN